MSKELVTEDHQTTDIEVNRRKALRKIATISAGGGAATLATLTSARATCGSSYCK